MRPAVAAVLVVCLAVLGCGGGGGAPGPPIEVDYTTFTDSLQTGPQTGALSGALESEGEPIVDATVRIALPGLSETEGYVTRSDAAGLIRIGNVPGGTYELFIRADGFQPAVFEVTILARTITAGTYSLDRVQT